MSINYSLFENNLTSNPNDYTAVVQNQTSRSKEDIIEEMISRGSTVTKAEALSVLEEFEAAVERALIKGDSINMPLFRISASIQGVFNGDGESFDRSRHYVRLNVNPGSRIGEIAEGIKVEKIPATSPAPALRAFRDIESELLNEVLTPGGAGEISGSRLKLDPTDENQGVFFIGDDGTTIRANSVIRNKPSNLIFMIPSELRSGNYQLEVRMSPPRSKQLRTGQLDRLLVVGTPVGVGD